IEATGREHVSQSTFGFAPKDGDYRDYPLAGLAALADPQHLETYAERYEYDPVGNILSMTHRAAGNRWTRRYGYEEPSALEPEQRSNRLSYTRVGADPISHLEPYGYDANGNVVQMPHLPVMQWDFFDRLAATARQIVNCGLPEKTFYVYDSSGDRVRTV